MGIIARQSFKAALVTYLGVILGVVNQVFIYPSFLTLEEYGEIQFVLQTGGFFLPIILFGVTSLIARYYSLFKQDEIQKQSLYGMITLIVVFNLLLFLITCFLFNDSIVAYYSGSGGVSKFSVSVLIILSALLPIIALAKAISSVHKRIAVPSLLQQTVKVVLPVIVVFYYFGHITFEQILVGILVYYCIITIVFVAYALKHENIRPVLSISKISRNLKVKPLFVFSIFSLLSGIGAALTNQIDIIMITSMKGTYENGLYSWGLFIANSIAIPYAMVGAISLPILSDFWKRKDTSAITDLYRSSSSSILTFSLMIFLAFWLGIDDLFILMPKGEEYAMTKSIVFLLCSAKILDMATGLNSHIISMSNKYKMHLLFLLIAASINVSLNWLLIPDYGIEGSGVATIISVVIFNFMKYWFLKHNYNMTPFSKNTLYIVIVAISLYFLVSFLPKTENSLLNILLFPFIFAVSYGMISYKLHLAPEINRFINKLLLRVGIKPFD
jgi:O-antigen/teichoic acid export membrane protein